MSEIKTETIWLKSSYHNQPLAAYKIYDAEAQPRAVLQITHGMAEYFLRYKPFAEYMTGRGYVVYGHDHLGHGATSGTEYPDGFFAEKDGRYFVLRDIRTVTDRARADYPDLPVILFGHSMGSFFARWAVETWPERYKAAVFCGTGGKNPAAPAGQAVAASIAKIKGPEYRSKLVNNLAFGSYCSKIENAETEFDWLSVDKENVAAYIADPKCGFLFTASAFAELVKVMSHVNSAAWYAKLDKYKPYLVVAGKEDPVGEYGKGPEEVARLLKERGANRVDLKLYDNMRHEILRETDCRTVWKDTADWCDGALE